MASMIGPWNGLAFGLQQGMSIGNDMNEIKTRRQLLLQKQSDETVDAMQSLIKAQLDSADKFAQANSQRTPEYETYMASVYKQIEDSIGGIAAQGTEKAKLIAKGLGDTIKLSWPLLTRTAAERAQADRDAKMSNLRSIYQPNAPETPTMGAVSPQGPQGPSVAPDVTPQAAAVSQQPAIGAMAQAQAQPQIQPEAPMPSPEQAQQPAGMQIPTGGGDIFSMVETDQIPARDIEFAIANPAGKDAVSSQYGVDVAPLYAVPENPAERPPSDIQMREMAAGISNPAREEMAKQDAKNYQPRVAAVNDARNIIKSNFQQRVLLRKGIIAGIGSDMKLWLKQAEAQATGDPEAMAKVSATRAFVNIARQKAAKIIKNFGAGTGLSDADLMFSMQLAAGDISMTAENLDKLIDISTKDAIRILQNPNVPAGSVDDVVATARANGMSDDAIQRALRGTGFGG